MDELMPFKFPLEGRRRNAEITIPPEIRQDQRFGDFIQRYEKFVFAGGGEGWGRTLIYDPLPKGAKMFDKLKKAVFPEDELAKRVEKLEARLEDKVLAKESVRLFGPVSLTERVDGWVAYTEKLLRRVQQLEKANRTLLKTLDIGLEEVSR
jgi:hypothetical protein